MRTLIIEYLDKAALVFITHGSRLQIPLFRLRGLCERAVLDGGMATVSVCLGNGEIPCLREPKTPFSPLKAN